MTTMHRNERAGDVNDEGLDLSHGRLDQVFWQDGFLFGIVFSDRPRLLTLHLELPVATDHPLYTGKRDGEIYCYRRAELNFDDYRIDDSGEAHFRFAEDTDGEVDLGSFHAISRGTDGSWTIEGSFGWLKVSARRCSLLFATS